MANSAIKKMRKPPAPDAHLNAWITGGKDPQSAVAQLPNASGAQVTEAPSLKRTETLETQVTKAPSLQVTEAPTPQKRKRASVPRSPQTASKPKGPGIVERADGSFRRRLVVYIEPKRALQLKAEAALEGRDMSDIVDELVEGWLESAR